MPDFRKKIVTQVGRPRRRWKVNVEMNVGEIGWG
jgi:hypothetical protein